MLCDRFGVRGSHAFVCLVSLFGAVCCRNWSLLECCSQALKHSCKTTWNKSGLCLPVGSFVFVKWKEWCSSYLRELPVALQNLKIRTTMTGT